MSKKQVTIEDLARMVKGGFDDVIGRMATKIEMNRRFDVVEGELDKIEKLILADHKRRIERLETEVKELKNMLAV